MATQSGFRDRPFSRPPLRQRSSTMTSLASSYKSPATSFTSTNSSDRTSQEASVDVSSWERPESATKTLLSRGSRMLKRQGSKFNLTTSLSGNNEEHWERQRKAAEVREFLYRVPKGRSKSAAEKSRASLPHIRTERKLTIIRRGFEKLHILSFRLSACHSYTPCPL